MTDQKMKISHVKSVTLHSRSQRPRSFWSASGIETSGRLQNRKSAIHGLIVKYDKSDWLKNTERVLCACSEIGSGQRSRSPTLTRRIAASGDENGDSVVSSASIGNNERYCSQANQKIFDYFFLVSSLI